MGKALEVVTLRADKIASLDVTEDITKSLTNRKDEIGMLANSFQKIINNLREFVQQISDTSEQVASSSKELTIASEQSALASDEVAKTIEDIAKGATHQAADTEDGAKHIDDLGENGYFVVYSQAGDEIAHPSLEGQNVWDVKDKSKDEVLLVQDSINKAINGGGFTYYDWLLPHSESIGRIFKSTICKCRTDCYTRGSN